MRSIREEVVSFNISLDDLPDGYSRLSDNGMAALEILIAKMVYTHTEALEFRNEILRGKIESLDKDVDALQDFAIWMTGCGYDFAALPYFREQRDLLLK